MIMEKAINLAVKIKETRMIQGEKIDGVIVYKSDTLVTKEEQEKADKLDQVLSVELKKIEKEMRNKGFLKLKGKKGEVLRLWYEVGSMLKPVLDNLDIPSKDMNYVYRAIYDHAGNLSPGPITIRALRRPKDSHFSYCCKLDQFTWDFVNKAGDWTSWSELFDSTLFKSDRRMIEWLATKQIHAKGSQQNWLRPLTKAIRNKLKDVDTKVLNNEELYTKLDKIYEEVHPEISN